MNVEANKIVRYELTDKQKRYEKNKEVFDRIAAVIGLVVSSPLLLAIAIAIKCEEGLRAPVIFKQRRVGKNRELFDVYKFRTMKVTAPHDVATHLLKDPAQYITKTGKFLRRTSLDEIPQFINIARGEMAISGPRSALWNQDDLIAAREAYGVHQIKPGLTGWAQIHGRDELEIPVKARLDAYYLKHFGLWIDIKCFLGTIVYVIKRKGVVEGGTGKMNNSKPVESNKPDKKLLAITNHSYMFWKCRRELIEELQQDYEVVISTPYVGHEDDLAKMGCRMIETDVDRREINPITELKLFKTYYRMLKQEKPDMVITYSIKPNIYAGLACRLLKIPYCINVQGLGTAFQTKALSSVVAIMHRMSCKKAKTVFFENQSNADVFTERHIIREDQVTVLSGAGVNTDYYNYAPYPEHEEVRFLYVGRIMKEKGIDELFYAIRKLYEKYGAKVQLDLVGFFEDEYKEQVDQLVADGIAVFHGFQDDPRPFYANADCVVLPSYHEGLSNVLLEAAAVGRCIVASNIPGCREAVDRGKSGLLCKVRDRESLLRVMEKIVNSDKKKLERAGRNGRAKMLREYNKEDVVEMTKKEILL